MAFIAVDGLAFHVTRRGVGAGEPLVLLHGFTGSASSWLPVVDLIGEGQDILSIDLIGHGASAAPEERARYVFDAALADLAAITGHFGIDRANWFGYSMGGRLALGLALRYPNLVAKLILESATPGIADPAERAARRAADERLARRIEELGIEAFVDEWERLPLWESQRHLPAPTRQRQRAIRLANSPIGLANSLRDMGQGAQPSFWDRLGDVQAPALLITGALDHKFTVIGERMRAALHDSRHVVARKAGHAVHLEDPEFVAARVVDFLAQGDGAAVRIGQEKIAWT
jgi:2-succinyl-6-hydroxy-2,4-cyclohexadiene-1-carboxylate synthase